MSTEEQIVQMAIGAAGPVGDNENAWRRRVWELTREIGVMFRPPHDPDLAVTPVVTARKVVESDLIRGATFDSYEQEDTSRRLIVKFTPPETKGAELEDDGLEHVRTEPMWTPAGREMKGIVENLVPGQKMNVFKYVEEIDGGRRKVRVMAHCEPWNRPRQVERQQVPSPLPAVDPDGGKGVGDASAASSAPASDPLGDLWKEIEVLQEKMAPIDKVRAAKQCREAGYENFITPGTEDAARAVIQIMKGY